MRARSAGTTAWASRPGRPSLLKRRDLAAGFVDELTAELDEDYGVGAEGGCPDLEPLPAISMEGGFSAWTAEDLARLQRDRDAQAEARREAFERNLPAERCLCLQGTLATVTTWVDDGIEEQIETQRDRLDGWSQTEIETTIMLTGVPRPVSLDAVRAAIEDWRRRRHDDWTGGDPNAQWGDGGTPFGWNDYRYRPSSQRMAIPTERPLLSGLRWAVPGPELYQRRVAFGPWASADGST